MHNFTDPPGLYRGRFAPSPSGPLHFGSLVTAVGSYLEAKSRCGEWLVRIEDLDTPRVVAGAADEILRTLEVFGLHWDGVVVYQSQRHDAYRDALERLQRAGWLYPCVCSRKQIALSALTGCDGPVYAGVCRQRPLAIAGPHASLRVRTPDRIVEYGDRVQGPVRLNLEREIGDFVLRRADGIYAYQLAVVVDDAWQGVTHVVRGADLLYSTARQIYLQQLLGYDTPDYLHLPLVLDAQGKKLSKQTRAEPVVLDNPLPSLVAALRFLGQDVPESLLQADVEAFWQWALANWNPDRIPEAGHAGARDPDEESMLRSLIQDN